MTNANVALVQDDVANQEELQEDDFEAIADYHRMAAHHFDAAAKHHLAAAEADEEGDDEGRERHAHRALRHQLHAVQYAEVAIMESEALDDEFGATVEDI